MMNSLKKWLRNSVPDRIKKFISYSDEIEHGQLSFSQFGEDLILRNFFTGRKNGFYVDVGAHHPIRYSNTYYFYKCGWRGITIDPLPGSKRQFERIRPRDTSLEIGIADKAGEIRYYSFKEPLENTFSKAKADQINQKLNPLREIITVKVLPLSDVLKVHLPASTKIDFLNIDAEGYDLAVLQSNDWSRYVPSIIVVENWNFNVNVINNDPLTSYLHSLGYNLRAFVKATLFFGHRDHI